MVLNEQQIDCIELMIKGETNSNIAKILDMRRATIYSWLKSEEFKVELDKRVQEIKKQVQSNILSKSEPVIDKIIKIAMTSKSEKTSLDACTYLIDHVLGRSTTKVADVTDQERKDSSIDIDSMLRELDNIIDLKQVSSE